MTGTREPRCDDGQRLFLLSTVAVAGLFNMLVSTAVYPTAVSGIDSRLEDVGGRTFSKILLKHSCRYFFRISSHYSHVDVNLTRMIVTDCLFR